MNIYVISILFGRGKKTVEETSETCLVLFCGVLYGYLFEIAILNIFPVLVCTVGKKNLSPEPTKLFVEKVNVSI
jgi:hypothetical protein